jgi:hypothetical protein
MEDSDTLPDVEAIVRKLRQGMDDTKPLAPLGPATAGRRELSSSLRKAAETSDVLGRCGGSIRGKLCKMLAFLVFPVIEQLNMHHGAVVSALNHVRDSRADAEEGSQTERVQRLEARIDRLEAEIKSLTVGERR